MAQPQPLEIIPRGGRAPVADDPFAAFATRDDAPATTGAPPAAANDPYAAFATRDDAGPADFHGLVVPVGVPPKPPLDHPPPEGVFGTTDNPTMLQSGLRGAAQGATLGFGDELHGLMMAGGDDSGTPGSALIGGVKVAAQSLAPSIFGTSAKDRYDQVVEEERQANEIARQNNPGSYFTGELGGSVASMGVLPALAPFKAAEAAPVLTRAAAKVGNLALPGAVYGGIAGAGGAEGDLGDRLAGAGKGAAIGAALAPAIGAGLGAAGSVGRFVGDHLGATFSPSRVANRAVSDAVASDSANLPAIADRMDAAQARGQDLTLADVAGPNTQALAGSVSRFPGPARAKAQEFLDTRQLGNETGAPSQGERIGEQVGNYLGHNDDASYLASLGASRRMRAAPAYAAAFKSPAPVWSPKLAELAQRPAVQSAIKDAGKIAANEGSPLANVTRDEAGNVVPGNAAEAFASGSRQRLDRAVGDLLGSQGQLQTTDRIIATRKAAADPLYAQARAQTIPDGAMPIDLLRRLKAAGALPQAIQKSRIAGEPFDIGNVSAWDAMKRSLDDRIGAAQRKGAGDDVRLFTGLKNELTDALDHAVPVYGQARATYAGHSEMLDALNAGRDSIKPGVTREQVAREFHDLQTPGEQEMYRAGQSNALREKLANARDSADLPATIAGNEATRGKLAITASSPEALQRFSQSLAAEDRAFSEAVTPDMKGWHYALRSLDEKLLPFIDRETGQVTAPEGQAIQAARDKLKGILEQRSPAYKAALNQEGSISDSVAALRQGSQVFSPSVSADAVRRQISTMSPQSAEAYRIGAANALKQKLGNAVDGANKVRMTLGNENLRLKMAALAPDQASRDAFVAHLKDEGAMFATRSKSLGGSPTAPRMNEDAEMLRHVAEDPHALGAAVSGDLRPLIGIAARHMAKVDPAKRGAVLKAINDIVLNPSPQTVRDFANRITRTEMKDGARQRVISAVLKALPQAVTTHISSGSRAALVAPENKGLQQ
jgi:hypothetical protein